MASVAYKDIFPEHSGLGKMSDAWWACFGLEESAMDDPSTCMLPMPAHDRLALLMKDESVDPREPDGTCPKMRLTLVMDFDVSTATADDEWETDSMVELMNVLDDHPNLDVHFQEWKWTL